MAKLASFSIFGKTNNLYKILCITPMVPYYDPKTAPTSLLEVDISKIATKQKSILQRF